MLILMYKIGLCPERVIEMRALSLFQGNPENSDLKPDFWNGFTKQTQNIYIQVKI